jgi:hypothetical protein
MADPRPILDYASPQKHGRVRLPTVSRIDSELREDGSFVIIERLDGRREAIGAIAFAIFMLIYLAVLIIASFVWLGWHRNAGFAQVLGTCWVTEAMVLVLVIDRTWRRTVLEGSRDGLRLEFRALARRRQYHWPPDHLIDLGTVQTRVLDNGQVLGELQIRPPGEPTIRLFTDHPLRQLELIAGQLGRMITPPSE